MNKYNTPSASERRKAKKSGLITVKDLITPDETVIWQGKPKKSAFIASRIISQLPLFIAIALFTFFWLFVVSTQFIACYISGNKLGMISLLPFVFGSFLPIIVFIAQIVSIVSSAKIWEHTEYAITDKRLIINSGFISLDYQSFFYKNIKDMTYSRDLLDRMYKVGDVSFSCLTSEKTVSYNKLEDQVEIKAPSAYHFLDIPEHEKVYNILKKVIVDLQTDIEYPNALRPEENPGFKQPQKSSLTSEE